MRFVPHANLTSLDPLWSTALISYCAATMIWDRLYGLDNSLTPRPQMVAGHELSDDRLHWIFTLREGLLWHDGEKVTARDCVASILRWAQRDGFGVRMKAQAEDIRALDDRRFEIRLKRPFPQMQFALGATACFMMPERVASSTPASVSVSDYTGSGPFIFRKDEWVAGARAVFERNPRYVSREEKPEFWAGGRPVHFDRIEWHVMPDPGTAASALQAGEVDWVERPLTDLVPMLQRNRNLKVDVLDPLGSWGQLRFNTEVPPFNNPKVARALLPALQQEDFMQSLLGDQPELMNTECGVFLPGTPMANDAGMEALTGPRDLELARKMLRESGYAGEPVIMMEASDLATSAAFSPVARQLLTDVGFKLDYQTMDWGSLLGRVNTRGGVGAWHCYASSWAGLWITNPAMHAHLYRSTPTRFDELRDSWFDAPDLPAQRAVAEQIQRQAFAEPPFLPCGQFFNRQAFSTKLSGFVKSPVAVFWNVQKA
nr:ABC transporter substrate-binding protein [Roseomonas marmotae]